MPRHPPSTTNQSLDQLEHTQWSAPTQDTYVTSNVYRLRRLPLNQYRIEDLRLMIGQQIGAAFLVPLALDHLELDPLAKGDFYPGDLVVAVTRLPDAFWRAHAHLIPNALRAIDAAIARIRIEDATDDLHERLNEARDRFAKLTAA